GFHCSKLLADMGADVIKIEPPGGDEARRVPPFKDDSPHPEKSLYFLHFNTNKRGITLDIEKPDGRAILLELARKADVLVESYRPAQRDELGLSYQELSAGNPGLVVASITPFGDAGPWRDYKADDIAGLALGNLLYVAGEPGEPPLHPPGEIAYGMASTYGAFGSRSRSIIVWKAPEVSISLSLCTNVRDISPAILFPTTATPAPSPRALRARVKRRTS